MFQITINKDEIAELEIESFPGQIYLIESAVQARKAIAYLRKQTCIGFDSETRPSFKKGVIRPMALMQFSTLNECFLFRINKTGITDSLKDFLEDDTVMKIGLSLKDDFNVLNRSFSELKPNGFIDIQKLVGEYKIYDKSLQKIYAILFNKKISKAQRLSNWEATTLTDAQQEYAAIDAWSCLKIYNYLKSGNFVPEKSIYYREIIEPTTENTDNNETI